MPAAEVAAAVPHAPEDLAEMLGEMKKLLAEATRPKPKLIAQPWLYVGVSKSGWYRMASADLTPKAVKLPGVGLLYRTADLDEFVRKLKTI